LRLRLLKQQAAAGDIILLFGDESEALTHPYLARAWAKRGSDLRVEAPGQAKKRAVIGALDFAAHKLTVSTSATKRSSDFIDFLGRLDAIYGPCSGRDDKPVIFVLDKRTHSYQQGFARRPRRTALAHRRMAAEIRPRAERHRALLARSEEQLSRPSDLHRC
jgi:hypothetical protein